MVRRSAGLISHLFQATLACGAIKIVLVKQNRFSTKSKNQKRDIQAGACTSLRRPYFPSVPSYFDMRSDKNRARKVKQVQYEKQKSKTKSTGWCLYVAPQDWLYVEI